LPRAPVYRCHALLVAACVTILIVAPRVACADVRISGDAEAMEIEADGESLRDVLAALRDRFGLQLPARVGFDQPVQGSFRGDIPDVLAALLEDYDYVAIRSETGKFEITFANRRKSGRQAVRTIRGNSRKLAALVAPIPNVRPPWGRVALARMAAHRPIHVPKAILAAARRTGCVGPSACSRAPVRAVR
jgi:hypothetical protein